MKKTHYFLIIFLLALVCGNLKGQTTPWSVNYASSFASGNGLTEATAYIISTPEQLARMAVMVNKEPVSYANKYYRVEADIDLSERWWDLLIGSESSPFTGKFDGNGKIISHGGGLFGTTRDAEIIGVRLTNSSSDYDTIDYIGLLIGAAYNTKVTNCSGDESKVGSSFYNIGGLIGYAEESIISDCSYSGDVSIGYFINYDYDYIAGGFIGEANNTVILNCSFSGTVNGFIQTGGFIGRSYLTTLNNCFSSGYVNGIEIVGGFAGQIESGSITNCFSLCLTSGYFDVGGFIGNVWSEVEIIIKNCYSKGSVTGISGNIGGFIGSFWGWEGESNIRECYSETQVTGIGLCNIVGGFIGSIYKLYDSENVTISNCYSISSTNGYNIVGGFIGAGSDVTIERCYSGGSVTGYSVVGGFIGLSSKLSFSQCAAGVKVEGDFVVGGFGGLLDGELSSCFAGGLVSGNSYVGSFCGGDGEISASDCFANSSVFGGYGFVGWSYEYANYENCYFDRQSTGIVTATESGDVEGITALTTIQLTQNTLPPGFSDDDWVAVAGYYPQLKVFANSDYSILRDYSSINAVPLRLANNTELVSNIRTFFKLADKTPDGKAIIWGVDPFEKVTIYNNTVYAERSNAWRTLTLRAGELERTFHFRAPTGLLSAEILDVKSNHPNNGDMYNYLIECGSNDISVYVDITLPPYASCTPGSPITLYPNIPQVVTVTSIDGQSNTYTFKAVKNLPSDIFIQRWDDVLAINNNFITNGGYNFTDYEWYKNGSKLPDTKGYIKETGGLSNSAEYTALLTTQQGNRLSTCPAVISTGLSSRISVYPNPVKSGQKINMKLATDEQKSVVLQLFNPNGNMIAKQIVNEPEAEITMPETTGTYILQITKGDGVEMVKVLVE